MADIDGPVTDGMSAEDAATTETYYKMQRWDEAVEDHGAQSDKALDSYNDMLRSSQEHPDPEVRDAFDDAGDSAQSGRDNLPFYFVPFAWLDGSL